MGSYLTQTVGFAALLLNLLAYQCKNGRRLILMQLGSNITYVIHFLMLGAYTGCLSISVMMLSNGLLSLQRFSWAPWSSWRGWRPILCVLFVAAAAVTWQGPLSLLPCLGTTAAAMFNWTRNGGWAGWRWSAPAGCSMMPAWAPGPEWWTRRWAFSPF